MHMGHWNEELTPTPKKVDGEGGKLVFLVGSLEALKKELTYPSFDEILRK